MANVVRLNNGGVIQVRTGVLQGIGPIGPRGLVGPAGPQGETGPQGDTGPMGGISQYLSKAKVSATTGLAPDVNTLLAFSTVVVDELSAFKTSTAFGPC